ncbi:MAG: SIR2 family protein [Nitrospira sp.]|jgi:hypothetical protein
MAKLSFDGTSIKHRGNLKSTPWCLCFGAGTSVGLVPSWKELTCRVLRSSFDASLTDSDISELLNSTGWNLESWIQTALNHLVETGQGQDSFIDILENELYRDLLEKAEALGLRESLSKAFNNPLNCSRQEIEILWQFFENNYREASALPLARVLTKTIECGESAPSAILNFNAETIVHTLFSIHQILENHRARGRWEFPKQTFKKMFCAAPVPPNRIPIYHLHGCILPRTKKRRDARERLIFPETDYMDMAGTIFSWAQTTFLHYAQSHRLVFVGHSLSDPNIRKWLAWIAKAHNEDLESTKGIGSKSATHIWFAQRPKDERLTKVMEHSLVHLGTRICWLNDWSQIEGAFLNLLALDNP